MDNEEFFAQSADGPHAEHVRRVLAKFHEEGERRGIWGLVPRTSSLYWACVRLEFAYLGLVRALDVFETAAVLLTENPEKSRGRSERPLVDRELTPEQGEAVLRFVLGYWLWLICSDGGGQWTNTVWGTPGNEFYEDVSSLWLLTEAEWDAFRDLDERYESPAEGVYVWRTIVERAGGDSSALTMLEVLPGAKSLRHSAFALMAEFADSLRDR